MSKQPLRLTDRPSHQATPWQWVLGRILFLCLSAGLVIIGWFYTRHLALGGTAWGIGLVSLVVLQVALTIALERGLAAPGRSPSWRYRLAFLISAGYWGISWLSLRMLDQGSTPGIWLLVGWFGAFLGGLLATASNEGWWENNSPPSERVRGEVHQWHLETIGLPDKTPFGKRAFDVGLASFGLLIAFPIWLMSAFLVWIEDPGPLLFVKNSVGKGGLNFHQYKFRTMVSEAETHTGPTLASESDERVLVVGRVLRKTALDELPQLVNILLGEMSFVGPRPQRTVLVHDYLQRMPEYTERHRITPGLAGLAQVAGDYYLTPRQKLRFDRLYIRHASLGFDLKLILLAFAIAFWYRWQKDWNGRLPRRLMRWGSAERTK
jgi:lipopolysaccharide/colanic/teichoic acid biosynthesis glycosyltransferase